MLSTSPQHETTIEHADLLAEIRMGSEAAIQELNRLIGGGMRLLIARRVHPGLVDQAVRACFAAVLNDIRTGALTRLESLPGHARAAVVLQISSFSLQQQQEAAGQETRASQPVAAMTELLSGLPSRDRQALIRYYVDRQPEQQILAELAMSAVYLRALKERVKARFEGCAGPSCAAPSSPRLMMKTCRNTKAL